MILSALFGLEGCGQDMVQSKSYDLMLQGILKEKVPFISVDSLQALDSSSYLLLDTRSRAEYEVSHIPGAVWVGQKFDPQRLPDLEEDQNLITYCSVGKRSEDLGAAISEEYGSVQVRNLYGGIFEWVNRGYSVVDEGTPTDSVHAYDKKWGVWLKKGKKVYRPEPGQKASR